MDIMCSIIREVPVSLIAYFCNYYCNISVIARKIVFGNLLQDISQTNFDKLMYY